MTATELVSKATKKRLNEESRSTIQLPNAEELNEYFMLEQPVRKQPPSKLSESIFQTDQRER